MQINVLNEIYDAYKGCLEDASSMWKSEYCCSAKEKERRDIEDKEDLKYFASLLQKIDNNFHREEIMQNKKIKVKFNIPLDYVMGHLRYGHKEGILEFTEEEFERLKKDPMNFIDEEDILSDLELIVDDYRIEDWGTPLEINYEVINNAE